MWQRIGQLALLGLLVRLGALKISGLVEGFPLLAALSLSPDFSAI